MRFTFFETWNNEISPNSSLRQTLNPIQRLTLELAHLIETLDVNITQYPLIKVVFMPSDCCMEVPNFIITG